MAHAFKRDRKNPELIKGKLSDEERDIVIELMEQTRALLDEDEGVADPDDIFASLTASMAPREAPQDSALRRLLPDGVNDDDDGAREFRRLTESNLRSQKVRNLTSSIEALKNPAKRDAVILDAAEARAMMMALTDVRLVLADRLGVQTEEDAEALEARLSEADEVTSSEMALAAYYDFLTWLSESVTVAVMSKR